METLVANQTPLMSLPHVGVDFYKKLIQYYKNQNKLPPTFAYLNGISNYIDTRLNKKLNDIDLGLELADMPYTLKDADLVTFDVRKYPGIGPKESKKLPDTGGVTSLDVVSQNYPKRVTKWLDSFGVTT